MDPVELVKVTVGAVRVTAGAVKMLPLEFMTRAFAVTDPLIVVAPPVVTLKSPPALPETMVSEPNAFT
jgi:hypothetical protein